MGMPFLSFANLKSQENMVRLFQSIAPLSMLLRNRSLAEELVLLREYCRKETVAVVEEVGWGLRMDFETEDKDLTSMPKLRSREHSFDDLLACYNSPPASPRGTPEKIKNLKAF